jgi:pectinesterase
MQRPLILILMLCVPLFPVRAQQRGVNVNVVNPSALPRTGELVELSWSDLLRISPSLTSSAVAAQDSVSGLLLPAQLIDADQDGTPDLLLVRVTLPPGGATSFRVVPSAAGGTPTASLTDARFVLPREDLAWENDRIAFRMYGPALAKDVGNGIDVWTKRVRSLIVGKWYKAAETAPPGKDPYHEDHGEGADYFSVGRTLGAGGCAPMMGDSLIQPGVFASHRIVATGPLRAQFELTYNPVRLGEQRITQKLRIAIDAGSNLNRIEVLFEAGGEAVEVPFAAGIVKRKGVTAHADTGSCAASLWGLTTDRLEEGFLGTGIVMASSAFRQVGETPVHLLLIGKATAGAPATYFAGAGWTRSGDFSTEEEWHRYLHEFGLKLQSPFRVTMTAGI